MKEDIGFQKIGKEIPFKAPHDFFETISEKTLQKAKQREYNRRKIRRLWRSVSAAASLAALFFLGYFMLGPDIKSGSNQTAQEVQPTGRQIIHQKPEVAKESTVAEVEKKSAVPEKTVIKTTENEVISDVLADLTDDELSQIAAMLQTDTFISESAQ